MPGRMARRPSGIDEFLTKLEDLVDQSKGKVRADVPTTRSPRWGLAGSGLTNRRAVAEIKGVADGTAPGVSPLLDKTAPSVSAAIDATLRVVGG